MLPERTVQAHHPSAPTEHAFHRSTARSIRAVRVARTKRAEPPPTRTATRRRLAHTVRAAHIERAVTAPSASRALSAPRASSSECAIERPRHRMRRLG